MTTPPVVVVGAGPVGLTVALSLAKQGWPAVVVEARDGISDEGSKALVIQRRTLELLDWAAPGVGTTIRQAGVTWNIKRTYYRDRLMFSEHYADSVTDSLPPFVNLPQTKRPIGCCWTPPNGSMSPTPTRWRLSTSRPTSVTGLTTCSKKPASTLLPK